MSVPHDIEELIADAPLSAHLATSVDDRPHVAPVWYVYEDGSLFVLTGGKKLRNLRRNSRVAVSIEKVDEDGVDWGVQLLGTARVVEDDARIDAVRTRLSGIYYGADEADTVDDGDGETDGGGEYEWALVEIRIGSATRQTY